MTNDSMALAELVEMGSVVDLLCEMIGFVAHRLMDVGAESLCGAGQRDRSSERSIRRNGYSDRFRETCAGSVLLRVPKLRSGSYFPGFLESRRTPEHAIDAVLQEACAQGVPTRPTDELVKAPRKERGLQ